MKINILNNLLFSLFLIPLVIFGCKKKGGTSSNTENIDYSAYFTPLPVGATGTYSCPDPSTLSFLNPPEPNPFDHFNSTFVIKNTQQYAGFPGQMRGSAFYNSYPELVKKYLYLGLSEIENWNITEFYFDSAIVGGPNVFGVYFVQCQYKGKYDSSSLSTQAINIYHYSASHVFSPVAPGWLEGTPDYNNSPVFHCYNTSRNECQFKISTK